MKRFPIVLACYFEYGCVSPEEKWRVALSCVSVGPPAVDYLVRHYGIHCFADNWLGTQKGRRTNRDREENNPKHGEAKLTRPMSWEIHQSADEFPDVVRLRES